jgi:hypothetical protein
MPATANEHYPARQLNHEMSPSVNYSAKYRVDIKNYSVRFFSFFSKLMFFVLHLFAFAQVDELNSINARLMWERDQWRREKERAREATAAVAASMGLKMASVCPFCLLLCLTLQC